jgi:glycosyltransferase involved in cell wall biosynthesis
MRVCVVYDCLYPYTIGGAERWYRNLSRRLAAAGHEVTYLTLRQWGEGNEPDLPGVRVIPVGPHMALYSNGRRRIAPPLAFGLGVLRHLAVHGRRYDVVHTASFPYFSLLAAGLMRRFAGYRIVVDWHEVWTRGYWQEYLGPLGVVGYAVQRLCMRIGHDAFCFAQLHAERLLSARPRGSVVVLRGQYEGAPGRTPAEPEPVVFFAGRHIPEKRVTAIVPAVVRAREDVPELRCVILGDGPDRAEVLRQIERGGLQDIIDAPGFVAQERVEDSLRKALCLLLPSRREGYGLIVVEAAARGTPAVVVRGPDNAAVEHVEEGVNGIVAKTAAAEDLGEAIVRVHRAGTALRESTASWFARNSTSLSLEASLEVVLAAYTG